MVMVAGQKYKVIDIGAYSHDMGYYWKIVETPNGPKTIVGTRGQWRFWTAEDRTKPLRDAIAKGWPNKPKEAKSDESE